MNLYLRFGLSFLVCGALFAALARWSCATEAQLRDWNGVMSAARCRREDRRAARRRRLRRLWLGLSLAWHAAFGREGGAA